MFCIKTFNDFVALHFAIHYGRGLLFSNSLHGLSRHDESEGFFAGFRGVFSECVCGFSLLERIGCFCFLRVLGFVLLNRDAKNMGEKCICI